MKIIIKNFLLSLILFFLNSNATFAQTEQRVQDMVRIVGIRENVLTGYGLVVGLNNTGDSKRFPLTKKMLQNFMGSYGNNIDTNGMEMRNSAVVLVSAVLPPFANRGDRIDLTVASVGDARSIEGGVLIQTPLYGPDKKIYGLGHGTIVTQKQIQDRLGKNRGLVYAGGVLEADLSPNFLREENNQYIAILKLSQPGILQIQALSEAIQKKFPNLPFRIMDGARLSIAFPKEAANRILADIMALKVKVPVLARVIIDEKNGVVVMGNEVKILPVAISVQGVVIPKQNKNKQDDDFLSFYITKDKNRPGESLFYLSETTSVKEVVEKINTMGASTRELIAMIKAIHEAGALQGELILR